MMINNKNKHLVFELLYKYKISKASLDEINDYIDYLNNELSTIEASDIAALNPEEFDSELELEWKRFLKYKKGGNS